MLASEKPVKSKRLKGFTRAMTVKTQESPPVAGAFVERPLSLSLTQFRKFYKRGDFPIAVEHNSTGNKISWKVEIERLDYHHYLPLFFEGLSETEYPYGFLARQGTHDMLEHGGAKVDPVIPQLIIPLKSALNRRNREVCCTVLKAMQHLLESSAMVGETLVPYYRQLLPIFNLFAEKNINIGDGIDYSQRKRNNIGDLVHETLNLLEEKGGEDAYVNIKYMVPIYESCVLQT